MKAKLKEPFRIDEKRTLIRGSIVEIVGTWDGYDGYYYRCVMPDEDRLYVGGSEYAGTQQIIKACWLEIVDYTPYIDWKQTRIQAAIAIMQANYANPDLMQFLTTKEEFPYNALARISVMSADVLIEELKKNM